MERAIDSDYAGLVVAPTNYLALVGSVRQALSKHIPTVVIRSSLPIPPGRGLSYILNDDHETGRLAATRLGTLLAGKGQVAVLGLDPSGPRSVLRARAIEAELARFPACLGHRKNQDPRTPPRFSKSRRRFSSTTRPLTRSSHWM